MRRITLLSLVALALVAGAWFGARQPIVEATEVTGVTTTNLLSAVTTGTGTVLGPGFMPRCRESAVYVVWSTGVNAGAVTIETAHDPNYSGTWAPLVVVTWSGSANKEDVVQITGIHAALRPRVSTNVTGGTVSVWATCN